MTNNFGVVTQAYDEFWNGNRGHVTNFGVVTWGVTNFGMVTEGV